MRIVSHPTLHPNCCFLCQRTTGAMIDTEVRGRFMNNASIGALYICVDNCARALLRSIGAHTGPEFDALAAERDKQAARADAAENEIKRRAPLIAGIAEAIAERTPEKASA